MKKLFLTTLILITALSLKAQFNFYWTNNYQYTVTSGFSNESRKVATDANGNIFVLSDVTSDLDSANHPGPTQYYVLLQKYSPSGGLITHKIVNVHNMQQTGQDYSSAFAMQIDASGSVYIGYNLYNVAGSNYDVGVTKFNNTLTTSWAYAYSTSANETGVDMVIRNNVAIVVLKRVSGANTTYVVAKAVPNSSAGTPLYVFDVNTEVINSCVTQSNKNIYFTGYKLINGVKNVLVASLNISGAIKFKVTSNVNTIQGDDYGTKIILAPDGYLYIVGTSYVNSINGNDALVLRYNSSNGTNNAQLLLNYPVGSNIQDVGFNIAAGTGGRVFVGTTKGNGDVVVYRLLTSNGVLVNASANFKPTPFSFTSLSSIKIMDMKVAPNSNNVYVCGNIVGQSSAGTFSASYLFRCGNTSSGFDVIDNLETNGSNTDNFQGVGIALDPPRNNMVFLSNYWLNNFAHLSESRILDDFSMGSLRLSSSDAELPAKIDDLILYPNPAKDIIQLKTLEKISNSVIIYDIIGKVVSQLTPTNNTLDISGIKPGVYLFKIISESGIVVKKVQIE